MFADADTGDGHRRLRVAFVIVVDRLAITLAVEADLGVIHLGAEVAGVAKRK
jgi:hypothetical protein